MGVARVTPLNLGVVSLTRVAIAVLARAPPTTAGFTSPELGEGLIGVLLFTLTVGIFVGVALVGVAVGPLVGTVGVADGAPAGDVGFTGTSTLRTLTGVCGTVAGGAFVGACTGVADGAFVGTGVSDGTLVGGVTVVGLTAGVGCEGAGAGAFVGAGLAGCGFAG